MKRPHPLAPAAETTAASVRAQPLRTDPENSLRRRLVLAFGAMPIAAVTSGCGSGDGEESATDGSNTGGSGTGSGTSAGGGTGTGSGTGTGTGTGTNTGSGATTGIAPTPSGNPVETTINPTVAATLVHPGLLHTQADFQRMRTQVAANAAPWADGWNALTASGYSKLGASPRPLDTVVRGGDGSNFSQMYLDMERTYQLALRWQVSGDTAYADLAVSFLDAWSATMKTLTGNADRFLAAGIYGYQWANAAEIMRGYAGWSAEGITAFQSLLSTLFYPLAHDFLINHNGSEITNYWANWDLCAINAIFAIGVFCDRPDWCNEALAYYTTGRGNGAAAHNVYVVHPGYLGQWQETSRDQGHCTLGISLAAALCEMAWNQGVDLYGYANNRLLAGAEYVAKANLTDTTGAFLALPFSTYANRQGTGTAVSDAGRPHYRPCWEGLFHHYTRRKGLAAPWVGAMVAAHGTEGNAMNGDQLGFGTLTFSRDPYGGALAPSGLGAHVSAGRVQLSWWGCVGATSYNVKRSSSAAGPFTTVASVSDLPTFTDSPSDGTWYYTVAAITPSGETANTRAVRAVLPSEARVVLALNGAATDSSGYGQHGTPRGGATWGTGRTGITGTGGAGGTSGSTSGGSALVLDGASGYLALPDGVVADLADLTFSAWVYWNAERANTRIFDFGTSDIAYLALIPKDSKGVLRLTATGTRYWGESGVSASAPLPTGRWVHVAATLSGTQAVLYVDGAMVGSGDIGFTPWQMGYTRQNWLGRSQYEADPYFNGSLSDVRLYAGALTASQVLALAQG